MLAFSFTPLPFWAYYYLGTNADSTEYRPDYIILLGSNGMPSPDGLMKCYYTARVCKEYPNAQLIIALPSDTTKQGSENLHLLLTELQSRGVDTVKLLFEKKGVNTFRQACLIEKMLPDTAKNSSVMIITLPEHVRRATLTFKKAGFIHLHSLATFEKTIDEKLLEHKFSEPKIEPANLALRYNFWNYLKLEITVLREYTALAYYKIRGWI